MTYIDKLYSALLLGLAMLSAAALAYMAFDVSRAFAEPATFVHNGLAKDGERYETYDAAVHTDKRPSLRVMLNFYVPAESAMKVIEGGTVWFKNVLKIRDKYGVDKWLFEIERHGEAGDPKTTYSLLPEEELTDELRARMAANGTWPA